MKYLATLILFLSMLQLGIAQDTTLVQTFTLDSEFRQGTFTFPDDPGASYEKIIMQYRMRCHDALVGNGNIGCREWDYHCNTVVTDSSLIDSVWSTHPSHVISGSSANPFFYVQNPTFTYYEFVQKEIEYTTVLSEDSAQVGNGTLPLSIPFSTENEMGKTQMLFTASDLLAAGLSATPITGLRFNIEDAGSDIEFLKIKMRHTQIAALDPASPVIDSLTEVYFLNTPVIQNQQVSFNFYENFVWDGASNLLIEFSFTGSPNGQSSEIKGETTAEIMSISTNENESFLNVTYGDYIDVPAEIFDEIDSVITISFWQYGNPEINPYNSYIFEGGDENNNRVINSHLPWSNSRVYWDAGNSGTNSYDRIDQAANFEDFAGKWNHWAFVKDATVGEMKIYLNGELWHSGLGKTKNMSGITKFVIAGNKGFSGQYGGYINEFRVWKTVLDQVDIQSWMYQDISTDHPNYNDLILYYKFNETSGNQITDYSPNANHGAYMGQPLWIPMMGHQLNRNFMEYDHRPNIEFVQGSYFTNLNEYTYYDSLQNGYNIVYDYYVENNDLILNDTNYYWEAGDMDIISEDGQVVGFNYVNPEDTINIETLEYYRKWPARYELLSFITPYGNGLDLGEAGVMWEFDVSDFEPVLKGDKFISIEGVGAWSEELDIRFLFIHGTPPRDVLTVNPIWPIAKASQQWYGFGPAAIMNDEVFEPRNILMNPEAEMFKIRSAVTGHGQNGEFTPKFHYMNIDGDANEFEYKVWNECSTIPVYPQGGTWIFDRAGWCPGDPTTLFEMDITPFVTPGQVHTIDYGLTNISSLSEANYRVANQIVTYSGPNFTLDAAIADIIKPNSFVATHQRFNPACMDPEVIIRNNGSNQLNSLVLEFWVEGNEMLTINWNGSLEFLETDTVILPVSDYTFWLGSENTFHVQISEPNGGSDEYANNNYLSRPFETTDVYDISEELEVHCFTNNYAHQNYYYLADAAGNIIFERDDLEDNTLYTDALSLEPGCYILRIEDSADNGLYYWYNTGQGSGYLRLKNSTGYILENFEPEFGRFAQYEFAIANLSGIDDKMSNQIIGVHPNPADDAIEVRLKGYEKEFLQIEIYNTTGQKQITKKFSEISGTGNLNINIESLESGVYILQTTSISTQKSFKFLKR